jgi:alpha-ketoglutarate-dependent taurine dioxygenase
VRSSDQGTALLFGHRDEPYLRINLNSMGDLGDDVEAESAIQELMASLHRNTFEIPTSAGDYLYLDNYRTTHGRAPYTPRYDGSDRWLRRLYITSYLRKSRHLRASAPGRVIRPELYQETCVA